MRVTTNPKLIQRRSRLGMMASFGGIAVLAVGMFASFRQQYMWVSLAALVIGFVLAQFGSYNLRRYGRSPRPDQVLETAMKGFDDRYHLYAWTLPVPFALLSPQGIYTFTTRDQTGQISVTGSTWRSKFSLARVLAMFGQEGLGNPTADAQAQAAKLGEWIKAKLPDVAAEVRPIVVFIDSRAKLDVNEPTVPVLDVEGIKKWLRGGGKGAYLKNADLKALEGLFDAQAASTQR
jgi:hypothetical protein